MEIAEGIHRIETPLGDRVNCVYLLAGTRCALLFDTAIDPVVASHVEPYLARVGVEPARVRYVVNSHCDWDHHGGNGAVRDLAPAAVLCCSTPHQSRTNSASTCAVSTTDGRCTRSSTPWTFSAAGP